MLHERQQDNSRKSYSSSTTYFVSTKEAYALHPPQHKKNAAQSFTKQATPPHHPHPQSISAPSIMRTKTRLQDEMRQKATWPIQHTVEPRLSLLFPRRRSPSSTTPRLSSFTRTRRRLITPTTRCRAGFGIRTMAVRGIRRHFVVVSGSRGTGVFCSGAVVGVVD
jgi:hypothetical protein